MGQVPEVAVFGIDFLFCGCYGNASFIRKSIASSLDFIVHLSSFQGAMILIPGIEMKICQLKPYLIVSLASCPMRYCCRLFLFSYLHLIFGNHGLAKEVPRRYRFS